MSLLYTHVALIVPLHACRLAALLSERLRLRVSLFIAHLGYSAVSFFALALSAPSTRVQ